MTPEAQTMIEKAARAMWDSQPLPSSHPLVVEWEDVSEDRKNGFRGMAYAAVTAVIPGILAGDTCGVADRGDVGSID